MLTLVRRAASQSAWGRSERVCSGAATPPVTPTTTHHFADGRRQPTVFWPALSCLATRLLRLSALQLVPCWQRTSPICVAADRTMVGDCLAPPMAGLSSTGGSTNPAPTSLLSAQFGVDVTQNALSGSHAKTLACVGLTITTPTITGPGVPGK